jgi:hypothetical protein
LIYYKKIGEKNMNKLTKPKGIGIATTMLLAALLIAAVSAPASAIHSDVHRIGMAGSNCRTIHGLP